jgi:hypothetical protein
MRRPFALALLALLAVFAGCAAVPLNDPARTGPFFTPENHAGEPSLGGLRRVVLLPVCGGTIAPPESAEALDPVFASELQKQNRFEVVALTRQEFRRQFGLEEISSTAALPREFMAVIRREYAADGVLFVDLTAYHSYRPLTLGIRAKLATVGDVRLVWTFDSIFAADNPAVANSARHYFLESDRSGVPADLTPVVLQSPSRFATYAAAAAFATLPPVRAAAAPASPPARNR